MRRRWGRAVLETLVLIVLLLVVIHATVQNFRIEGHSMEPTLHDQEIVLVDRASYLLHAPARGDVIVFQYPLDRQVDYVKRIIAIPGDIISVIGSTVTVDGVILHETYINKANTSNPFPPISQRIVGPGEYFVMGDNRGSSSDSRQWGLVPRNDIIGRATLVYWPFAVNNAGILPDASSVFASVHQ